MPDPQEQVGFSRRAAQRVVSAVKRIEGSSMPPSEGQDRHYPLFPIRTYENTFVVDSALPSGSPSASYFSLTDPPIILDEDEYDYDDEHPTMLYLLSARRYNIRANFQITVISTSEKSYSASVQFTLHDKDLSVLQFRSFSWMRASDCTVSTYIWQGGQVTLDYTLDLTGIDVDADLPYYVVFSRTARLIGGSAPSVASLTGSVIVETR